MAHLRISTALILVAVLTIGAGSADAAHRDPKPRAHAGPRGTDA